jgi:alcohol dehydrogenase class IV
VGVGGGSALDVAKLVAALHDSGDPIESAFGIGNLKGRRTRLVCMPTTSGTGSETSPNAILLDEDSKLKRAVVSPHLVADSAYVDPELTLTVPPEVTAYTGMDALTHCIEAYANVNAHPMIDLFALEGMGLIAANLRTAYEDGANLAAREAMALGSLYGGLCLGPVNTGAVHALAYPLGGEFHVAHGLSNAVLLPHVLEYNIPAMPDRYAQVARALGAEGGSRTELARRGLEVVRELMRDCHMPLTLSEIGIPREAIPAMAESALTVTRLLKNNPRELAMSDAIEIYQGAY